jgi:hypothetical protein
MSNGVWWWSMKYISPLSTSDHKKKAHIDLQLWVFGYGSNYGPISKKIIPQEHCGVWRWGKFAQFQHQILKDNLVVGFIWPRIKRHTNYTRQHNVWLWGLTWPLMGMEVIINGQNTLIRLQGKKNSNVIKQPQHTKIFRSWK